MTQNRVTSQLADNGATSVAPFEAGKNVIMNGAFDIWQRGTSFTPAGSVTFSADRCFHYWDGTGTHVISQQTFTPGAAPVAGYEGTYFFRHQQTVAGSGGTYMAVIGQRVEDVRVLAGQTATLSFWAKADAARTYYYYIDQIFGTGGSSGVTVSSSQVNMTTSWQRFSFTVSVPSIAGKTIGTGSYLSVRMDSPNLNITQTVDIWGIQLEAGAVATPFTRASGTIQGELAACQRYYWRNTATQTYSVMGMGFASSATNVMAYFQFPVPMRATPSSIDFSTLQANDSATGTAISNIGFQGTEYGPFGAVVNCTTSGMTTYRPTKILANGSTSGYIGFSAEI